MTYITTFDAAFFTALAQYVLVIVIMTIPFIRNFVIDKIAKKPKEFAITAIVFNIVLVVVFFSWSVKGTTTIMFWGFVFSVTFNLSVMVVAKVFGALKRKLVVKKTNANNDDDVVDAIVRQL